MTAPDRLVAADGERDLFGFDWVDRSILAQISHGSTNPQIAYALNMPVHTVQNRICRAMRRLDASNRAHLAAIYVRRYEGISAPAPYITCGAVNPATGAVCELGPHPERAEHYGPDAEGRRRTWQTTTVTGPNPG